MTGFDGILDPLSQEPHLAVHGTSHPRPGGRGEHYLQEEMPVIFTGGHGGEVNAWETKLPTKLQIYRLEHGTDIPSHKHLAPHNLHGDSECKIPSGL